MTLQSYIKLPLDGPHHRNSSSKMDGARWRGSFLTLGPKLQVTDVYVSTVTANVLLQMADGPNALDVIGRKLLEAIARDSLDGHIHTVMDIVRNGTTTRPARHNSQSRSADGPSYMIDRHAVFYSEDGTSARHVYFVEYDAPTLQSARETLESVFPATRCEHSYDCCARWYQSSPKIQRLPNGKWMVTQSSNMNV